MELSDTGRRSFDGYRAKASCLRSRISTSKDCSMSISSWSY